MIYNSYVFYMYMYVKTFMSKVLYGKNSVNCIIN